MTSARYVLEPIEYPTQPTTEWKEADELLEPWLDRADVLLTTNGTYSLYYFDDYDLEISKNIVSQTASGSEFGRDTRTGRHAISTAQSLREVISCFRSGLFVGHAHQWGHEINGINDPAIEVLVSASRKIETPRDWRMKVYYWERSGDTGTECRQIRQLATTASGRNSTSP